MRGIQLEPARDLLAGLTLEELARLCRARGIACSGGKPAFVGAVATRLDLDDIADALLELFPARRPAGRRKAGDEVRLDRAPRLAGDAAVQVLSRARAGQGRLMLESGARCLRFRLGNVPLFLENRAPVIVADAGSAAADRMFDGFSTRRRLHPAAGRAPSKDRPFIIDDGSYGLRNGRLRLDLRRTGLISWRVDFLRWSARAARPEYLLRPIA
ncbi:hypothetical protein JXB37_00235 [candidate division WOR-3 bacterium]|nr:hypothetical protein [candidate division WOR-3 bacterium]